MIAGINYPWTLVAGRPNYGCDFGRNIWNSHTGVSTHESDVRADFTAMAAMGVAVVRWFVFTDGRGGVRWRRDRRLDGLDDLFFTDMDAALACARAAGVRLCLVLFDYAWMHDPLRRALAAVARDRAAMIDALIEPLLDAYGTDGRRADLGQAIHSFDIINEPDWVTAGLEPPLGRETLAIDELRAFVGEVAARIHARSTAMVTLGGGRVRFAAEWDHPAYGLDFIQVHSYPDVRYPDRDATVFGRTAASFGLSKPLLIGEHAASPRQHPPDHLPPAYWPRDYEALVRDGGYLGAWPWSFKGVDPFGSVTLVSGASLTMADSLAPIVQFIQSRFTSALAGREPGLDEPLFSSGVIDSFGVLELIAFLEDTFQVTIDTDRHELGEFDTVNKIGQLLSRLRGNA